MHRVLVIEDDPTIRNVLRVLLLAEEYRVIECLARQAGMIVTAA